MGGAVSTGVGGGSAGTQDGTCNCSNPPTSSAASLTPQPTATSPCHHGHAECPDSCVHTHWAPTSHLAPPPCQALGYKDSAPTVSALAGPAQEVLAHTWAGRHEHLDTSESSLLSRFYFSIYM